MIVSIVGLGFVGNAIVESMKIKDKNTNLKIIVYDKFKDGGIGNLESCIYSDIIFLCLPTLYDYNNNGYDLDPIHENLELLNKLDYKGLVVIKSTILPGTTNKLVEKYKNLNLCHNPEFLTARTAIEDFLNQDHIILGKSNRCNHFDSIFDFYKKYWPKSKLTICKSNESEAIKISCNCFYSVKIQFFNELYLMCNKNNIDFNVLKNAMLENGWINKMHTDVPGHDGKLSYGGMCFPKDTKALFTFLQEQRLPNKVLKSTIEEREMIREKSLDNF